MSKTVELKIGNDSFDVLYFRYGFCRKTDSNGYPVTGMTGGEIQATMESDSRTALLEYLAGKLVGNLMRISEITMVRKFLHIPIRLHPACCRTGSGGGWGIFGFLGKMLNEKFHTDNLMDYVYYNSNYCASL